VLFETLDTPDTLETYVSYVSVCLWIYASMESVTVSIRFSCAGNASEWRDDPTQFTDHESVLGDASQQGVVPGEHCDGVAMGDGGCTMRHSVDALRGTGDDGVHPPGQPGCKFRGGAYPYVGDAMCQGLGEQVGVTARPQGDRLVNIKIGQTFRPLRVLEESTPVRRAVPWH
jgi:hypothetical protein